MRQVKFEDAKNNLLALIEAALGGEQFIITKDDGTSVQITPVRSARKRPQFGSAEGMIKIADDFDEPLADFEATIGSGREPRPFGLCAGEFVVPDDFDAPLPDDVLAAFES